MPPLWSREPREPCAAIARNARQEIGLPGEIVRHSLLYAIGAFVGFEPDVDRLVGHQRVLGGEWKSRGLPRTVATGKIADRKRRVGARLAHGETGKNAVFRSQHHISAQR